MATFIAALSALHCPLDDTLRRAIEHLLPNTHLLGRWQVVSQHPYTVCDTGHNVGGWIENAAQLRKQDCQQLRVVIGFANDKDVESIIHLLPEKAFYYLCQANINRALPSEEMLPMFTKNHLQAHAYPTVKAAYLAALADAGPDDMIYIGGSNFVVGEWMEET